MPSVSRRRLLAAAGTGLAAGLAGCSTGATDDVCGETPPPTDSTIDTDPRGSAPAPGSEWPVVHRDAAHTGFADVAGPREDVGVGWRVEFGNGWNVDPVVADGLVVARESEAGVVRAFDPTDGSTEWSADGFRHPLPPAVGEGTVYVADRTGLAALDLSDGAERWTFAPEPAATPTPTPESPDEDPAETKWPTERAGATGDDDPEPPDRLAVAGPVLPLGGGGALVTTDRTVHAVGRDGTERWQVEEAHLGVVADGAAYLHGPGGFSAVDVATGDVRWTREETPGSPMAVRDGTVYAGGFEEIRAVDVETGEERWTFEGEIESFRTPVVGPDTVYAPTEPMESEDGGNLYALDRESGDLRWCQYLGFGSLEAAADGSAVYVATEEVVEARAAADGELLWRYGEEYTEFRAPAVVDGALYVGSWDGLLFAFAEATRTA